MVKESKKEFKIVFFSIIILLIMFASLIIPDNVIAFGLNKEYSSVLEDLEKDYEMED